MIKYIISLRFKLLGYIVFYYGTKTSDANFKLSLHSRIPY